MTSAASTMTFPTTYVVGSNNDQPVNNTTSKARVWCGHGVSAIGAGISKTGKAIATCITSVFQATITGIHHITSDVNAAAGVFRKLDQHVLKFFQHLSGPKEGLKTLGKCLRRNVAFIDFFQVAADVHYFVCGKYKAQKNEKGEVVKPKDTNLVVSGRLAFAAANIGGALLWLEEMSFLSLSKVGKTLGEARVFSFVPKAIASIPVLRDFTGLQKAAKALGELRVFSFISNFKILPVVLRALELGYALFAIDAARRLFNASNKAQAISTGIELSSYLAELTLSVILFAGVTNVIGLGIAGATCITLAATSFLYRVTHEDEIKQKPQQQLQLVAV